ncbi:RiPP maturation radical SAM C-methyltransferase [Actinophytocola sp.]|uniref:RiPP maturation radical SAM C-methyltransferase n=1 Tax=Actinophytocola sp. TaxID=1872138 RepID=UPI00389A00FB
MSVALVSMPFMDAGRPAIQVGLLRSIAAAAGFTASTLHANLGFAARVGAGRYRLLAEHRGCLVGDWLFAVQAFGDAAPDPGAELLDVFAEQLGFGQSPEDARRWLLALRDEVVPAYLDDLVAGHDWGALSVVGFSCTFQQTTASIALARRLKARHPELVTLFGGANFDGEMGPELVRGVPCIDVAVVGEADDALPALLSCLAEGVDPGTTPGVISRTSGELVSTPPAPPRTALDDLPIPDHTEYFATAERLGLTDPDRRRRVWVPVETARGCWWGAKHHCVFCGLNAEAMRFRSKSPERVLRELAELTRSTGSFRLAAVDNILDHRYLTTLLPRLAESELGYELFFEVKGNLGREQVRLLGQAGVRHVQPGIESLSSAVLRLMRKGVTAAQNVNLLRWARYYGVDVAWNLLWGIPGETAEHQAAQAALLPDLVHLQPPGEEGRIWLERFSPLFREPDEVFAFREPERSYRYVYPPTMDLARIAYFFDYELTEHLPAGAYDALAKASRGWREAWQDGDRPHLEYRWTPGLLEIDDTRHAGRTGTYTVEGYAADVYVACSDRPRTAVAVHRQLRPPVDVERVRAVLDEFARLGLVFLDEDRALALAIPATGGR